MRFWIVGPKVGPARVGASFFVKPSEGGMSGGRKLAALAIVVLVTGVIFDWWGFAPDGTPWIGHPPIASARETACAQARANGYNCEIAADGRIKITFKTDRPE